MFREPSLEVNIKLSMEKLKIVYNKIKRAVVAIKDDRKNEAMLELQAAMQKYNKYIRA